MDQPVRQVPEVRTAGQLRSGEYPSSRDATACGPERRRGVKQKARRNCPAAFSESPSIISARLQKPLSFISRSTSLRETSQRSVPVRFFARTRPCRHH